MPEADDILAQNYGSPTDVTTEDILRQVPKPPTSEWDLKADYPHLAEQGKGSGFKDWLHNLQPDWMKDAQWATGTGMGMVPKPVWDAANFLLPAKGAAMPVPKPKRTPEKDNLGFTSRALERFLDMPHKNPTPDQIYDHFNRQGVKQQEIDAMRIPEYLEGKANVPHGEFAQYLRDNRLQMNEGMYGGMEQNHGPIRPMSSKMTRDEEGMFVHDVETSRSGKQFRITEDRDAGNVYVQDEKGEYLPIRAPMNRQGVADAHEAIRAYLEGDGLPEGAKGPLKWGEFTLGHRGADNPTAREHVLSTADDKYTDPHFRKEPGYLWHDRTGVETTRDGRRALNVEEVQGRFQKLRDDGKQMSPEQYNELRLRQEAAFRENDKASRDAFDFLEANKDIEGGIVDPTRVGIPYDLEAFALKGPPHLRAQAAELRERYMKTESDFKRLQAELESNEKKAPWHPLADPEISPAIAIRRILQRAVDEGVDGITVTPSKVQLDRYPELSAVVDGLRWNPDTKAFQVRHAGSGKDYDFGPDHGWTTFRGGLVEPNDLRGLIGKNAEAALLAAQKREVTGGPWHQLDDLKGLEIGKGGMQHWYDRAYPNRIEKEMKTLDPSYPGRADVELMDKPRRTWDSEADYDAGKWYMRADPHEGGPFPYFPITPKVREAVKNGLPIINYLGAAILANQILNSYYPPEDQTP